MSRHRYSIQMMQTLRKLIRIAELREYTKCFLAVNPIGVLESKFAL